MYNFYILFSFKKNVSSTSDGLLKGETYFLFCAIKGCRKFFYTPFSTLFFLFNLSLFLLVSCLKFSLNQKFLNIFTTLFSTEDTKAFFFLNNNKKKGTTKVFFLFCSVEVERASMFSLNFSFL